MRDYSFWLMEADDSKKIVSTASKAGAKGITIVKCKDGSTYEVKASDTKGEMPKVGKMITDYIKIDEAKDYDKLAETCNKRMAESEDYKAYFQKKLDAYKVKSPSELSDEDKKKFYDEVDAGWKDDQELDEANTNAKTRAKSILKHAAEIKKEFGMINASDISSESEYARMKDLVDGALQDLTRAFE